MDFSALSALEVTFTSGSPDGAQQSVDIVIIDDAALKGDHEFIVELISINPSSVMIGMQSNTTVTITDNEGDSSLKRRLHMRVGCHEPLMCT